MALNLKPWAVVSWLSRSSRKISLPVVSFSPKPPKKNPRKAKFFRLALATGTKMANASRWTCTVGDTVLFAKYAGTEIKMDGKKLLILRESDLLAIVEG